VQQIKLIRVATNISIVGCHLLPTNYDSSITSHYTFALIQKQKGWLGRIRGVGPREKKRIVNVSVPSIVSVYKMKKRKTTQLLVATSYKNTNIEQRNYEKLETEDRVFHIWLEQLN
jgi:hypothetical protein